MWSGPRNISTAMMRSFGSRSDTVVTDEPFYAHYLAGTGVEHPLRDETLAAQSTDALEVAAWLSGPIPEGHAVWYQKHMTHHILPGDDRSWMLREGFEHVFLVREPRAVVGSLLGKVGSIEREETGVPQQVELFEWIAEETGRTPVVIDAREVLLDPAAVLSRLCARVGLPFEEAMLSWEPGPRETDGVWGTHWYDATWASTGFAPYRPSPRRVPPHYAELVAELEELHERVARHALRAPVGDRT
jgi:hypothetical protein